MYYDMLLPEFERKYNKTCCSQLLFLLSQGGKWLYKFIHMYVHMQQYHAMPFAWLFTLFLWFWFNISPQTLTASTTKSTTTLHWFGCNWEKFWFCHFPSHTHPHILIALYRKWNDGKLFGLRNHSGERSRATSRTRDGTDKPYNVHTNIINVSNIGDKICIKMWKWKHINIIYCNIMFPSTKYQFINHKTKLAFFLFRF